MEDINDEGDGTMKNDNAHISISCQEQNASNK